MIFFRLFGYSDEWMIYQIVDIVSNVVVELLQDFVMGSGFANHVIVRLEQASLFHRLPLSMSQKTLPH